MIHAYLDMPCPGAEDVDEVAAEAPDSRTMHGYKFWTMRREVAEKLGIPTWAIPTGRHHRGTRLDAYWTCQQLETRAKSMQMAAHGEPGAVIVPK
jgi:exonuclease III